MSGIIVKHRKPELKKTSVTKVSNKQDLMQISTGSKFSRCLKCVSLSILNSFKASKHIDGDHMLKRCVLSTLKHH